MNPLCRQILVRVKGDQIYYIKKILDTNKDTDTDIINQLSIYSYVNKMSYLARIIYYQLSPVMYKIFSLTAKIIFPILYVNFLSPLIIVPLTLGVPDDEVFLDLIYVIHVSTGVKSGHLVDLVVYNIDITKYFKFEVE